MAGWPTSTGLFRMLGREIQSTAWFLTRRQAWYFWLHFVQYAWESRAEIPATVPESPTAGEARAAERVEMKTIGTQSFIVNSGGEFISVGLVRELCVVNGCGCKYGCYCDQKGSRVRLFEFIYSKAEGRGALGSHLLGR